MYTINLFGFLNKNQGFGLYCKLKVVLSTNSIMYLLIKLLCNYSIINLNNNIYKYVEKAIISKLN